MALVGTAHPYRGHDSFSFMRGRRKLPSALCAAESNLSRRTERRELNHGRRIFSPDSPVANTARAEEKPFPDGSTASLMHQVRLALRELSELAAHELQTRGSNVSGCE